MLSKPIPALTSKQWEAVEKEIERKPTAKDEARYRRVMEKFRDFPLQTILCLILPYLVLKNYPKILDKTDNVNEFGCKDEEINRFIREQVTVF
ncbi:MAG: hypothetical protein LBQ98_03365 [Nitrososphaerota archaeon]|jgi:hypothetical protein|nr:hypothetical protein [Nitrososphaerota archaeon]